MFTGIVEEVGAVKKLEKRSNIFHLVIEGKIVLEDIKKGDSLSVNGCCLTVTKIDKKNIYFDLSTETAQKTNLMSLKVDEKVNLERALRVNDRLGGHFVTGHVDSLGKITSKKARANSIFWQISIARDLKKYIVPKGSIAVEGVSLTVNEVSDECFTVCIIPHTIKNTNLVYKKIGDKVNIEVDMLGKYVYQATLVTPRGIINEQFLKERGFI